MNHFAKIVGKLPEYGIDAMLLTHEANRFYASGFRSSGTDGAALVMEGKSYYFTDSRYTEAAGRIVRDAEIREVGPGHGYTARVKEAMAEQGIRRLGFE